MTCDNCKHFHDSPHQFGDRECDGWCVRYPQWIRKNKPTRKCGEFKNKEAIKRVPRKIKSLESEWSTRFKEFMDVFPCYREPDKAWKVWDDLALELHAGHIVEQAKKYAALVKSENREAKYIKSNKNWLQEGGWKTHYDEANSDPRDCIDCGASYQQGFKYTTVRNVKQYRCEDCREAHQENQAT